MSINLKAVARWLRHDPYPPDKATAREMYRILPAPKEKMKGKALGRVLWRALKYVFSYPFWLIGDVAMLGLFNYMGLLATILVTQIFVDNVLQGEPLAAKNFKGNTILYWMLAPWQHAGRKDLLAICIMALLLIGLVCAIVMVLQVWFDFNLKNRCLHRLRMRVYSHYMKMSVRYHSTHRVGDMMYRVQQDSFQIQPFIQQALVGPWNNISVIALRVGAMLAVNVKITLIFLAFLPLAVLLNFLLVMPGRKAFRRNRETDSQLLSVIEGTLSAMKTVTSFGRERSEITRFRNLAWHSLEWTCSANVWNQIMQRAVALVMGLGSYLVFFLCAYAYWRGEIKLGQCILFTTLMPQIQQPVVQLTLLWGTLQMPLVALDRVFTVLDQPGDLMDRPDAVELDGIHKSVAFEKVFFGYDPARPVLRGIDLEAVPGTITALVGPVGAGKSTLLSLIPRFADPQQGQVKIDGVDVRHFTMASLRSQASLVMQENPLFSASILENILYGAVDGDPTNPMQLPGQTRFENLDEALRRRVEDVTRLACLDEFIAKLPDGYNSPVGERASRLNVGEQQRLAIARALMRNAPVLILDEPTSALDAETEMRLMENLRQAEQSRITFIVTHRLATVSHADRICFVREGQIVESGTHEELMAMAEGQYREFYEMQYGAQEEKVMD